MSYGNIIHRYDGSYVINGGTYHVPNTTEFAGLWYKVHTYAAAHPERVTEEGPSPEPTLEEARAVKLRQIDADTSAAILAGFDYDIGGVLQFSYDAHDQQNFADAANAATLAIMGVPGVPTSCTWNGWKVERDADGNIISRTLERLDLTPEGFLGLYMAGALAHKARCMEAGGLRKEAAEAAQTLEELEAV